MRGTGFTSADAKWKGIGIMPDSVLILGEEILFYSDCSPHNDLVAEILSATNEVHVMSDPTGGGLATALKEIATAASCSVIIDENKIPLNEGVR